MRSILVTLCLAASALVTTAQKPSLAPVSDVVSNAKTVFIVNDSGTAKLGDAFYREVTKWNRWQVVTDRGKADLVLVVSESSVVAGSITTATASATGTTATGSSISAPLISQGWYLHVIDEKTGKEVWTVKKTGGAKLWITWNSIAKALLQDIRDRIPAQ